MHVEYEIAPCTTHSVLHLQFGQLDRPRADVIVDESAEKLSNLEPKTVKESRSSLDSCYF